ncbi:hypothetical protein D3C87_1869960 [compost metagenome]
MHITGADDRTKNRFDTTLDAAFDIGSIFKLRVIQVAAAGVGLRQQMAALIDYRDVTRRQTCDGA